MLLGGGTAFLVGAFRPLVAPLDVFQPPQQLIQPEPLPGQHLPHHPVDPRLHEGRLWGLVIRGIFSPPILLQTQEKGSSQQAQGHVVMPARPAPGLVLVQPHVALLRLKLRFNAPPGTAHVGQRLQGSVLGSIGQIVAGYTILKDNFWLILTIEPSELSRRKSLAREQTMPNRKDAEKGQHRRNAKKRESP